MYRRNRNRKVAKLIAASSWLLMTEASRADVLDQPQAGIPAGHAVMLDLRMPLGASRKTLTLAYGPMLRAAPPTARSGAHSFAPRVEAGLSFGGGSVSTFGSLGRIERLARRVNADGEPDSGNGRRALYVLGGILIVGGLVAVAVNDVVDTYEYLDEHYDPKSP